MSSYIHPENQELLWKIINKNPHINEMFSKLYPVERSTWFKSIIEKFYERIGNRYISTENLNLINKETLSYMIKYSQTVNTHQLLPESNQNMAPRQQQQQQQQQSQVYEGYSKDLPSAKREEKITQMASQYEKEYKTLLEKKEPEQIDFKEKIEDTAIKNMEELVEKQKRERELEIQVFPAPTDVLLTTYNSTSKVTDTPQELVSSINKQELEPIQIKQNPPENIQYEIINETPVMDIMKEFTKQLNEMKETIHSMKQDLEFVVNEIKNKT
jgi:hypothetical protein